MARLNKPINSSDQDDSNDFSPIPPGWYNVEINEAEIKTSSSGDYDAVNVTFRIIGPTNGGRLIWNWFNYDSAKVPEERRGDRMKKAIQIGRSELNRMCRAAGLQGELEDTDDLLNRTLQLKIAIDKKDSDRNAVKGYKAVDGENNEGPSNTKPAGAPPWM